MANNQELLHVRGVLPNRTYIGSSFCPGSTGMRNMYEGVDAGVQLAINDARSEVQQGANPQSVVDEFDRLRHTQLSVLRGCLANIAAGKCQIYPLDK